MVLTTRHYSSFASERQKERTLESTQWLRRVQLRRQVPKLHRMRQANADPPFLVSFPGSGNTWLRHLIQQGTRVYSGSTYKDVSLQMGGFPAEFDPPRPVGCVDVVDGRVVCASGCG